MGSDFSKREEVLAHAVLYNNVCNIFILPNAQAYFTTNIGWMISFGSDANFFSSQLREHLRAFRVLFYIVHIDSNNILSDTAQKNTHT